jgi:hypothetical protein
MRKNLRELYGFEVGDEVVLLREPDPTGIVVAIDHHYDHGGTTTCEVVWGTKSLAEALDEPLSVRDIQWTNKVVAAENRQEEAPTYAMGS